MKLVIGKPGNETVERPVYLWPEGNGDGGMVLCAGRCSPAEKWYVLQIKKDGAISLYGSLPSDLGFKLDNRGRVVIE